MSKPEEEKLREEFDKEFKWFHIDGVNMKTIDCLSLSNDLKDFICKFLAEREAESREKLITELRKEIEQAIVDTKDVKDLPTRLFSIIMPIIKNKE